MNFFELSVKTRSALNPKLNTIGERINNPNKITNRFTTLSDVIGLLMFKVFNNCANTAMLF